MLDISPDICCYLIWKPPSSMSWSGARTPGAAGPVTCAATRNARSARGPRKRTRWARSPAVA